MTGPNVPVVDASVVVDWAAPDVPLDAPAPTFLCRAIDEGAELVAPRLMLVEAANALLTGIRRGRWEGSEADASSAALQSMPIGLLDEPADLARAWELSRRYDRHPVYDMVYVAVAERLGLELVTAHRRLLSAVGALGFVVALPS